MKYFFILGNNPTLSLAEILAVLKPESFQLITNNFLLIDIKLEINPTNLIKELGGVIKIGKIRKEINNLSQSDLSSLACSLIKEKMKKVSSGKFNFGFSDYSEKLNIKDIGLNLKKEFTKNNISTRFVVSKDKYLSSVTVEQNKLIKKGIEITMGILEEKILVGETLAVQPFKSLSFRDYGRPQRDDRSGMLPPKLAQIMINLAKIEDKNKLILDPFCGSGTVLSEAMLKGYTNLQGFDISYQAIQDSKKNIDWIKKEYDLENINIRFLVKNVLDLSKFVKTESVNAIITEPYLGPQRGKIEFDLIIKELEYLYSKALIEFYKILVPTGRVVMIWPIFYGSRLINPDIYSFKVVSLLPNQIKKNKIIAKHINTRGNIVYGRKGQKVFREIIVLEK